jgi:hypothetical protein
VVFPVEAFTEVNVRASIQIHLQSNTKPKAWRDTAAGFAMRTRT